MSQDRDDGPAADDLDDDDKGKEIGALLGGAIGTAVAAKTGKELELVAGSTVASTLRMIISTRARMTSVQM